MKVELYGVELYGYHGVGEEERAKGQRFIYDLELEVGEQGADDRIEGAVDYREVAACLKEVAAGQYRLLEALASAIAEALVERFRVEQVKVRVRKPEVSPAGVALDYSAVTVERPGRRLGG
jgi:dihydroneopterin aldolase